LVERRSPKPDVGGSSPPGRAELLWSKAEKNLGFLPGQIFKPVVLQTTRKLNLTERSKTVAKKDEATIPEQKASFNPNTFVQETREELDKVVWPSRQQLISESIAVILMVTLSATLIYLVDQLFRWAQVKVFG
jgi:preprotein translocase subunit SecE